MEGYDVSCGRSRSGDSSGRLGVSAMGGVIERLLDGALWRYGLSLDREVGPWWLNGE